jgi:hypothetical protein
MGHYNFLFFLQTITLTLGCRYSFKFLRLQRCNVGAYAPRASTLLRAVTTLLLYPTLVHCAAAVCVQF